MYAVSPKRILVPFDFSDPSRAALRQASDIAETTAARLIVLYADRFFAGNEAPPEEFAGKSITEKKQLAEKYLRIEIDKAVSSAVPTDSLVVMDDPIPAILNAVITKGIDWIVMGTHGRRGLSRLVLGSVTESVMRQTDRPLLAVHAA
jgi:nucleotide-binding universal stress UspA family protein